MLHELIKNIIFYTQFTLSIHKLSEKAQILWQHITNYFMFLYSVPFSLQMYLCHMCHLHLGTILSLKTTQNGCRDGAALWVSSEAYVYRLKMSWVLKKGEESQLGWCRTTGVTLCLMTFHAGVRTHSYCHVKMNAVSVPPRTAMLKKRKYTLSRLVVCDSHNTDELSQV